MRLDRQIVATVFASAFAFWLFPMFFGTFTLVNFGGTLFNNLLVAIIAWFFVNLTYMGAGRARK